MTCHHRRWGATTTTTTLCTLAIALVLHCHWAASSTTSPSGSSSILSLSTVTTPFSTSWLPLSTGAPERRAKLGGSQQGQDHGTTRRGEKARRGSSNHERQRTPRNGPTSSPSSFSFSPSTSSSASASPSRPTSPESDLGMRLYAQPFDDDDISDTLDDGDQICLDGRRSSATRPVPTTSRTFTLSTEAATPLRLIEVNYRTLRRWGGDFWARLQLLLTAPRNVAAPKLDREWVSTFPKTDNRFPDIPPPLCRPYGLLGTIDRLENQHLPTGFTTICSGHFKKIEQRSIRRPDRYSNWYSVDARTIIFGDAFNKFSNGVGQAEERHEVVMATWVQQCRLAGVKPSVLKYLLVAVSDIPVADRIMKDRIDFMYEPGTETEDDFFALLGVLTVEEVPDLLVIYPGTLASRDNRQQPNVFTRVKTIKNIRMRRLTDYWIALTLDDVPLAGSRVDQRPNTTTMSS